MARAYISSLRKRKDANGNPVKTQNGFPISDIGFTVEPEKALRWDLAEAENFGHHATVVLEGADQICRDFRIEKNGSGDFIVSCEGPFRENVTQSKA